MRTRAVWIYAVDLANSGRFDDFPDVVLDSLLADIVGMWRQKDMGARLVLAFDEGIPVAVQEDPMPSPELAGTRAAVVRWAADRGAAGVNIEGDLHEPPRWL
jgi:maleylpyruvate isomerase